MSQLNSIDLHKNNNKANIENRCFTSRGFLKIAFTTYLCLLKGHHKKTNTVDFNIVLINKYPFKIGTCS